MVPPVHRGSPSPQRLDPPAQQSEPDRAAKPGVALIHEPARGTLDLPPAWIDNGHAMSARVHVSGRTKLTTLSPQPTPLHKGDAVPQLNALRRANALLTLVGELGVNLDELQRARHNDGKLRLSVDAMVETNAYYTGESNQIVFGTALGRASLGDDPDVLYHEAGHYLVQHLAGLGWHIEDSSINEGFADFVAASAVGNPNVAERLHDIFPLDRNAKNNEALADIHEPHYRGKTYSGLFWSLREKLQPMLGEEAGARMALELALKTVFYSNELSRADDLTASLRYAISVQDGFDSKQRTELATFLDDQIIKRNLVRPQNDLSPRALPERNARVLAAIDENDVMGSLRKLTRGTVSVRKAVTFDGVRRTSYEVIAKDKTVRVISVWTRGAQIVRLSDPRAAATRVP